MLNTFKEKFSFCFVCFLFLTFSLFAISFLLFVCVVIVFILFAIVEFLLATDEALSQADVLNKTLFDGSS